MEFPERFPGFRSRLARAMVSAGYVRSNGKPDSRAFAAALKTNHENVYRWLRGSMFPDTFLPQIAESLHVSAQFLQYGTDGGAVDAKVVTSSALAIDEDVQRTMDYSARLLSEAIRRRPWRKAKLLQHWVGQVELLCDDEASTGTQPTPTTPPPRPVSPAPVTADKPPKPRGRRAG